MKKGSAIKIPTKSKNPNGLHQKYFIQKIKHNIIGEPFLVDVDKNAEYFVLRLDENGDDEIHIAACRKAIQVYAKEIKSHLPKLSKDLIKRYENGK